MTALVVLASAVGVTATSRGEMAEGKKESVGSVRRGSEVNVFRVRKSSHQKISSCITCCMCKSASQLPLYLCLAFARTFAAAKKVLNRMIDTRRESNNVYQVYLVAILRVMKALCSCPGSSTSCRSKPFARLATRC